MTDDLFQPLENRYLFKLKFNLIDLINEDVLRFGALQFLNGSLFEHFSYIIKTFVRFTSLRHASLLEEAVRATRIHVGGEESSNSTVAEMREETLFRPGTVINLAASATSTLSCLSHIDKNAEDVLGSQCLKTMKDFCGHTNVSFLSCDVVMNFVKPGFLRGRWVATRDSYKKLSAGITLQNLVSEKLRKQYADNSLGTLKGKL